jgi:hypothetical protein
MIKLQRCQFFAFAGSALLLLPFEKDYSGVRNAPPRTAPQGAVFYLNRFLLSHLRDITIKPNDGDPARCECHGGKYRETHETLENRILKRPPRRIPVPIRDLPDRSKAS